MNWDAIGAIAELLGAVGVIASLVYLATQMRQNTRAMRASAYQEVVNQRDAANIPLMQDGELALLCSRGIANLDDLSEEERTRFEVWLFTVLSNSDNIYYQYQLGAVEEERWQQQLARLTLMVRRPGARAWWATSGSSAILSAQFVALVEEILAEETDRGE